MESDRKIIILIMDGLGDRAIKGLGYKTPLQCAKKPNLNWFAENGANGIMDVIGPGIRPGSDTSHLAILGYDPYTFYTGRGPFEAAGVGIACRKDDIAFRCNFATVDKKFNVIDRRAGRIKEPDTLELVAALADMTIDGVEVIVKEATEHRAVLLLRGEGLSPMVTDADPHATAIVLESKPLTPEAKRTAKIVNEFVRRSYEILEEHPLNVRRCEEGKVKANILLPRGAGVFRDIQPFQERFGITAACVAGVTLIKGIGRVCGLEIAEVPGATGGLDTNMEAKARTTLRLLNTKDLVVMNIKATDIPSHDGDPQRKIEVIEQIDAMAGILRNGIPPGTVVVLTADHCTPCERGDHSGDPVPLTIFSEDTVKDKVMTFDEAAVPQGGLGRIRGKDLMPILLDKTDRSEKFGA